MTIKMKVGIYIVVPSVLKRLRRFVQILIYYTSYLLLVDVQYPSSLEKVMFVLEVSRIPVFFYVITYSMDDSTYI